MAMTNTLLCVIARLGTCCIFVLLNGLPVHAVAQAKTITAWIPSFIREASAIRHAVETFKILRPDYRVELSSSSSYINYQEWVASAAATGTLPCLIELDGPFLGEYAWRGLVRSLDEFISADMRQDLLPSILDQGTFDGRLYSIGQFESGLGLWANRRYLRAAGVRIPTVEQPWTLAEFEQAMERLARVPGVDYPLNLALYTGTSEFYAYAFLPLLAGFGGDFIDRGRSHKSRGVLDGPASVSAMKRLQHWLGKGWTRAVFDRNDDFEKGRNAILWTGHWKYNELRQALGNDLTLLPLPNFGHGLKTGMGSWSWSITSTCRDPVAAWAFLQHLMSPREILYMTNTNGAVPARRSALRRSPLYGPQGPLRVYAQQLSSGAGFPRPAVPGYGTISKAFSVAVEGIVRGGDVQSELTRAAHQIDAEITASPGQVRQRQ
jgi:multiple sugar transport system substrate-binding protein